METPANKVPANLEGSAVPDRSAKRPGKEEKSKRKDDKSVDQVMKGLNNLETTEEKLAAMCKKFAEVMDENRKLQLTAKQFEKGLNVVQREKEQLQTDHSKAVLTRSRLESLCRELQRQNKAVKEESLLKVREEEEKRKEVSAKFNATLAEITSLMSSSNEKTNKLRDENLDITKKFKSICEQNGLQQQQVDKMNMQRKLEAELSEAKLTKQKLEFTAEKEILLREKQQLLMDLQEARTRMCDMNTNESALKSQVALYSDRYEEFQNALSRSNEVFGGFKGEMDKMSKKIVKLEKETMSWKNRWEKSHQALLEMATDKQQRDAELALTQRQLAQLQKLCRTLQTERTGLLAQIKGSEKPSDTAGEEATVSSNSLDINTDVGDGDNLSETPFVLNGLANVIETSKVEQPAVSIKEPELAVDPVQPKLAAQEAKQNKSGGKTNKKAKSDTVAGQTTALDNSSMVEKSKHSEQEAKSAKIIVPKNDKPVSTEKSVELKKPTVPSDVQLVVEKKAIEPTTDVPMTPEIAKPADAVVALDAKNTPAVNSEVVVEKQVATPKVPVEIKTPKGGNQKVNKKSKPAQSKQNDVVKTDESIVVEKVISTDEVKAICSHTEAVNAPKPINTEKVEGKDSKPAKPENVVSKVSGDQEAQIATKKPIGVLPAENIKSLEASVGKVDTSLKTQSVEVPVPAEKKEAAKVVQIKLQENDLKLEQPKVQKPVEIKEEIQAKNEKLKDIKDVKQVMPSITQKDKQGDEEKPGPAAVAQASPKIATMADKVKATPVAKAVGPKQKEAKKDEVVIANKTKPEAQKVNKSPSEESNVKLEVASTDSKPSGSISVPVEKPRTPVENTINAILRVLEASIKQKQSPKELAKEPTSVAAENTKELTNETQKLPLKETVKVVADEPAKESHASPAKGPVKENPSSNPSPIKEPVKHIAKEVASEILKTPAKAIAKEAPKVAAKESSKDTAKISAAVTPKNSPKSQKNDKVPPKPPAKDSSQSPPKAAAKPTTPQSSTVAEKEGRSLTTVEGDSKLNGKEPTALPGSTEAKIAAAEVAVAPAAAPALSVGASELKETLKVTEQLPVVPPSSTDKSSPPLQTDTTETKKVKEYHCPINFSYFFGWLVMILYLENYLSA